MCWGHLSLKEAKEYWESNLMDEYGEYLDKIGVTPPNHDDVYEVCGGAYF